MPASTTPNDERPAHAGWPLLHGRLSPPVSRSVSIKRPRLIQLLNQSSDYEVTLVNAPAGYGKTTIVSQWYTDLRNRGELVAWVSLDEMDSEAKRILMYLAASLSRVDAFFERALEGLFASDFNAPNSNLLRSILSAIEAFEQEIVLIVDDVHAQLEQESLELFRLLVGHSLSNLHLVLAYRENLDLPLARHRMQRTLLELGPRDLQFTQEEARGYFGQEADISLTQAQINSLCERTDGWVAGLQLALLSLRGRDNPDELIQSFSGQHRDVDDLIREEVLSSLSTELVEFLTQTSVLSSFNAALCDELLNRTDSADVIKQLETRNFFLFPMDEQRDFYRYHRLFADSLQNRLKQTQPGRDTDIHRQAADWFYRHDLPLRACLHADMVNDKQFLSDILGKLAPSLRALGYQDTLSRYCARLPADVLEKNPRLQLDNVYALTLVWRFDEATRVVNDVRASLTRGDGVDEELYAELIHREGQLALLKDDNALSERLCLEWLELEQNSSAFDRAVVLTTLISTQAARFEYSRLQQADDIRHAFENDDLLWATVWHDCIIGSCHFSHGRLDQAEARYRTALDAANDLSARLTATPSMPGLFLAELAFERGQRDEANDLLNDYLDESIEMGMLGQLVAGFSTRLRLLREQEDHEAEFNNIFEMGERVAKRRGFERLHRILLLERYKRLLDTGQVDQCLRIARADGLLVARERLPEISQYNSTSEPRVLAWVHIAIARNNLGDAEEVINKWRKMAESREAYRTAVRFTVLGIRNAVLRGDKPKASRLLQDVLRWAAEYGFRSSITDGGAPVIDLLKQTELSDKPLEEARQSLLDSIGMRSSRSATVSSDDTPVEALNARETQILRLAEQGLMNKQIAHELGLTTGTVKWYMQQIFDKLSVRRRAQAIHKAKHLGLLS